MTETQTGGGETPSRRLPAASVCPICEGPCRAFPDIDVKVSYLTPERKTGFIRAHHGPAENRAHHATEDR